MDRIDAEPRRVRRQILAILAVCAAPVIAAWIAYVVWQPQARMNYGALIEPRVVPDPELRRPDGDAFRLSQLRGKWLLLQFDSGACAERCRRKLYTMRQLRLAQGKDRERIERVWLLTDERVPDAALLREYDGTHALRASESGLVAGFPAPEGVSEYIYVVDPLGNLMLRFPRDPEPGRMLKDLARLIRVSRIG